uniref:Cupin type-1 domain-containing protein n=1 Tax=Leersia perrieri TaxID=77586 RepID=A0A0D9VQR9_9ORYZ
MHHAVHLTAPPKPSGHRTRHRHEPHESSEPPPSASTRPRRAHAPCHRATVATAPPRLARAHALPTYQPPSPSPFASRTAAGPTEVDRKWWRMAVSARTAAVRWLVLLLAVSVAAASREKWWQGGAEASGGGGGQLVRKEWRRVVSASDAGLVTAVDVADAAGSVYRLHFITMSPGTLFLPVQLHADMVFYVHSGRGKVTHIEEGNSESSSLQLERGDVYNFEQGTIIYIQSYPCDTREHLQIYAIFTSDSINADNPWRPTSEAYSSVSDLLKGFEVEVLRPGFAVPREVVEAIKSTKSPPAIIPYNPEEDDDKEDELNWKEEFADALLGVRDPHFLNKKKEDKHKDKHKGKGKDKKSKSKAFNFYSGKPDVENCYGWSRTMTNRDLETLHGSNIGMFMVNLTTGAMMGPHWNPRATEFAIVSKGSGIVQIVCPIIPSGDSKKRPWHHDEDHGDRGDDHGHGGGGGVGGGGCKNSVLRVKEGDVFVVPQYHPMAQISFNNDSFVFVGFSTDMGHNHPQFLAGKQSVLQLIGKEILALSLGQENSTAVGKLLSSQRESTIMACTSCAEELERKAEKEEGGKGKREREEEERRQEEEWKRKEKERERKEREEEERRQWEKEKKRREEEERARREQEEEERRRREQEEEERRRREEEEQEGGRGDEPEPRREEEEEEEGDWGDRQRRLSRSLKKRYHGIKGGLYRGA